MRRAFLILFAMLALVHPAAAQDQVAGGLVPERRTVLTRDVDFYGADLQALFDTTLPACQALCLNDSACAAFTFNTRSNACFPKSAISDRTSYEGAVSGRVIQTEPERLGAAATLAARLDFLSSPDRTAARTLAQDIGSRHMGGQWTPQQLTEAARNAEAQGDLGAALNWTGAALAQSDGADLWLDYARLSLARAKGLNPGDRPALRDQALAASINGFLRADPLVQQVSALLQMSGALEALDRGRTMVSALRLAETIAPRPELSLALERAVNLYGFRITDHEVESDGAAPRVCASFSEDLARAGVDYAPFVRLPDDRLAVLSEERRLCVTGLAHGERYTLTFRAGLPAASGEVLSKDVSITAYVRDRAPRVSFPGRAYVLPKSADAGLPVETVNLSTLDLTLRRVSDRNLIRAFQDSYFGRPLSGWELQTFTGEIAEEVWSGTAEVEERLNADVLTRLPMGDVVGGSPAGIYALTASIPGADPYDEPGATQWFVLSDIGLTTLAGSDGLTVFARGLSDAAPLAGLEVTLLSRANRVLATAKTDGEGVARFGAGLMRGTGGTAPALITAARGDEDLAFLSLTDPAFDLSDRGVEGRAPSGPLDLFLATDRGAYRAGEVIHATALLRDASVQAVNGVPLTAILTRPDGVEYSRHLSATGVDGGHVFDLPLAPGVARGTWRLALFADPDAPALATRTLLVEDFIPERIDVTLALPEAPLNPRALPPLSLETRYLFGAPGADLEVEGELTLIPETTLEALPGYQFGRHDAEVNPATDSLGQGLRTDAAGALSLPLILPDTEGDPRPQSLRITARVSDGSGRPVERSLTRALAPRTPLIGIRPEFDGTLPEGSEAQFLVQAIGPDLTPEPMQVTWQLNRVETRYQWYQMYGNWNWEPVTSRSTIATGEASLGAEPLRLGASVDWGEYELVVERADGAYTASSVGFEAGWYAPAGVRDTPDTLELSLDRARYAPGDTAQLRIVPRYAGQALITVLSDHVIAMKAVEVPEGASTIDLPVTREWGAGAYVTAQVLRPMDLAAGQAPARSLGLAHAGISPGERALDVRLEAPQESAPRAPLTASVLVKGAAPGETAHVTVAAVDLGILNLTDFDSPDPTAHYFGQRRLGVEIRDIYGRLIDGMNGAMGEIRSGGDAGSSMRMMAPPPTEQLVAQVSGLVTVNAEGRAELSFDMPDFNGTVRLMALAWTRTAVGEAEADVLVRDPVVMQATLPRFVAPGDRTRMLLELTHASGPEGAMPLSIKAEGLSLDTSALPGQITLAKGETTRLTIPLTAEEVGDHPITLSLTTPGGQTLTKRLTLGTRANDPQQSVTRRLTLEPGETLTLDAADLAGMRPDSAELLVSAGPLARFDVPGLLASLDRYPYGCTEQLTSKALPLLYLSSLSDQLGLDEGAGAATRIDQSITRILSRQAANGAFGLWRAGSGDFWLDAYVTDFLTRAQAQGHAIPDLAMTAALDNLRNRIAYAPDFEAGGEDIAYALMVLARQGRAAMGDLRYYADQKRDAFATPLAQAQLGAALALYGDQTRADRLFSAAAERLSAPAPDTGWRDDYGTALRDTAAVLTLAAEAGTQAIDSAALVGGLPTAARPLSTQEQAWSLMAAHALIDGPGGSALEVDGVPVAGALVRRISGDALTPVQIENTGSAPSPVTLTALGVPMGDTLAAGYGYALSRDYFTLEGKPVTGPITQGDRLVVVVTVRPADDTGARLLIDDPLPAGLEIDNPNLLRAGDIRSLDWLQTTEAEHSEFRADRFLAAVNQRDKTPVRLAYMVRAVSPGRFHHPAALVEDMYRPEYRATTASGSLVIQ